MVIEKEGARIGIGFATGRKSFQKVLRSYIYNWKESGLVDNKKISLNLYIAYDLDYHKTQATDYTGIHTDLGQLIDGKRFIGERDIKNEIGNLIKNKVLGLKEARTVFGRGYASKRNIILYCAIKDKIDYLVFLDDDEYPVAVTRTKATAVWGGQHVLTTHLQSLAGADITHGHHCGYISPIPYVEYNDKMAERDFRLFIEAISNDILSWEKIKKVMENGGVTYADANILMRNEVFPVEEKDRAKFISGSNLGINLTDPLRVLPFYNPPGARGEDTFLSTLLGDRKVLKVPCYTFHDGFATYHHLLEGVLPIRLKFIKADNEKVVSRFYKACIGWVRYKPLFVYLTSPGSYEERVGEVREKLAETLPKVSAYFERPEFLNILPELERYAKNVEKHHQEFKKLQALWARIMAWQKERDASA